MVSGWNQRDVSKTDKTMRQNALTVIDGWLLRRSEYILMYWQLALFLQLIFSDWQLTVLKMWRALIWSRK